MKRREFIGHLAAAPLLGERLASVPAGLMASRRTEGIDQQTRPNQAGAIDVGSKRQLFLDDLWFARQDNIKLTFHRPVLREVIMKCDRPWEAKLLHFTCTFRDGDRFRMWYGVYDGDPKRDERTDINWFCYAESRDGIVWEKPNLGLVERKGSRENNIVFPTEGVQGGNASVILDRNAPASERYKMITRTRVINGYVSEDGLKWRPAASNPFISEGMVDSHNILVWDDERERYVIFMRGTDMSVPGPFKGGRRAIRRSESPDFRTWSKPELVVTADDRDPVNLHFYTNATVKYERAARAFVAFPMVFYPERSYPGAPLPGLSDVQFASSRDGVKWERRFREPMISPGLEELNWVDRNPIVGQGILQTRPDEISLYYSDLYRSPQSRIRRCTWRTDGFVSVEGPYYKGGEFTTHPLRFSGRRLELNYSTSGGGSLQVELQDEKGSPLHGFSLADCPEIFGDKIEGIVRWKQGEDLAALAGKPVRLRVRLRDAHLYAFRFQE